MNIAYISADFGVPIFGYKGASVHVREMVAALRQAGHAVWVISPAIEEREMERLGERVKGREGEWVKGRISPHLPLSHSSSLRVSHAIREEAQVAFFPVHPSQERHCQLFKALDDLDKFLGKKTRLAPELRNLSYNLALYERARDYLLLCNVDFIYERYSLFGFAGIRLARELEVPHILEVNAPLAYEQEKMRGLETKELARETERRIFCESDRVIAVSGRLQEYAVSRGVPESRIHVLPNAVDPQRFAPLRPAAQQRDKTVRAQYQLEDKHVIGFVGSLKPWHGTETLFEAFRRLHATAANTHLLIVGDGPGREELEKYAHTHALDGAVTFTGNVSYDDIPQYLAAMDIAVAPYVANENFYYSPIKIFEYMAMGKPVVAGSIGQVEEVIADGETGLLFEPGNIGQLAAALAKLVEDSQLCRRLGEKARTWVLQERTWENNARRVIAIANELMET
ncbi:glycosyltransferase family 4 protein [candidate division KSB1 bacterium]|nr:glycosyltransferase family 4 protein [candidate division KSB1 bacterium]